MKRFTFACLTLAAIAWVNTAAFGETGNELFEKALVKERAEGDLHGAIKLYQQVVDKYGKDRSLAAKSLVAIGDAHRKLGDAEARKVYERVLREYTDQQAAADVARTQLVPWARLLRTM